MSVWRAPTQQAGLPHQQWQPYSPAESQRILAGIAAGQSQITLNNFTTVDLINMQASHHLSRCPTMQHAAASPMRPKKSRARRIARAAVGAGAAVAYGYGAAAVLCRWTAPAVVGVTAAMVGVTAAMAAIAPDVKIYDLRLAYSDTTVFNDPTVITVYNAPRVDAKYEVRFVSDFLQFEGYFWLLLCSLRVTSLES